MTEHISVVRQPPADGGRIVIELDEAMAYYVWECVYALGEHIAAGVPLESMPEKMSDRLGEFLRKLEPFVVHGD